MGCLRFLGQFLIGVLNFLLLLISLTSLFFGIMTLWFLEIMFEWFNHLSDIMDQSTMDTLVSFLNSYSMTIGITLFVLGVVVLFISFLGFCGACCSQSGLMLGYFLLIFLITAGIVTVTAMYGIDRTIFTDPLQSALAEQIRWNYDDVDNPARKGNATGIDPIAYSISAIFRFSPCCGIVDYQDFQLSSKWNTNYSYPNDQVIGAKVPVMCCKENVLMRTNPYDYLEPMDKNCLRSPTDANSYMSISCFTFYLEIVHPYILWTLIGLSIFLFRLVLLSLYLAISFKQRAKKRRAEKDQHQQQFGMGTVPTVAYYVPSSTAPGHQQFYLVTLKK